MPYCLYLRKSRTDLDAEANGETETLARHEKILLDLAKRMHLDVTEIYREVVSRRNYFFTPCRAESFERGGKWSVGWCLGRRN